MSVAFDTSSSHTWHANNATSALLSNFDKKCVVFTSTAKQAEFVKKEIDNINDAQIFFDGDSILTIGDLDPEVKFAACQKNSKHDSPDAENILNNN